MRLNRVRRALGASCVLLLMLVAADDAKSGGDTKDGKAAKAAAAPPAGWRERFDAVYRLGDEEVVKLVGPPFIPERADYYRRVVARNPNANLAVLGQFMFWWDGKLQMWSLSSSGGTVASALANCGGLERYDMEIDDGLRLRPVEGDWIVRKSAPREKRIAALQDILRQRLRREVVIEKRKVEREVVAVSGTLPRELPGGEAVHLYTDPRDLGDAPSGGGSGTLTEFFASVGGQLDRKFIDETAPPAAARRLIWHWHMSASGIEANDNKIKLLLANLSQQTGLTFTRRTDEVEVWKLTDPAEGKTGL